MHGRRALACLALGLAGLGLGVGAAAEAGTAAGLISLAAGLCAGAAGLVGWSRPAIADQPTAGASADGADRADAASPGTSVARREDGTPGRLSVSPPSRTQSREAESSKRLEATERAVSELTGDMVLSGRPANGGEVLIDPATGLYSERYLLVALEARIAAARRRLRPVSVVMMEVVVGVAAGQTGQPQPAQHGQPGLMDRNGQLTRPDHPGQPTPADPQLVAAAVRSTLREADTASRTSEGRYVLVLEDTAENGAVWSVERLRSRLVGEHPDHTLWAGVACYPAHAFNLDEILDQAANALEAAKEWRQDRIEVATAD